MKLNKQGCDMQSCFLCKLSLKEWLPAVEVHRKAHLYKKGEVIINEGDEVKGIYFVTDGVVKVHKKWGDKELIVRFAKKGDIFGHRGLGKDSIYPISATALESVTVCFIELSFFKQSLRVNFDFIQELLMFYSRELQESEKNMRNLAHMPVKGRLAQALLLLEEKFGTSETGCINITLSRQDLASYVGTTYETVFRVMGDLVQENLIEIVGKDVRITHYEDLKKLTIEA